MEIPALIYFSSWSLITITSLQLGFTSLHKQDPHISPLTIFLLKSFLTISVCHSSTSALVHRSTATKTSLTNHLKLSLLGFPFLFYLYISSGGPIPLPLILPYSFIITIISSLFIKPNNAGLFIDFIIRSVTFSLPVQNDAVFPLFVLIAAFFTAGADAMYGGARIREAASSMKRKVGKFGGMALASFVFHVAVRLESWWDVVAYLWFGVAWLGCVALTMARFDGGVFYALVCNLLIGCGSRFGFSGPTWFADAAGVVLFVLHDKILRVRFVRDGEAVLW